MIIKKRIDLIRGQALLLVLLAMAAVMTVVLSVASRSITDVSITSSEEDALRAFSAAEAGIEKTLLTGNNSSGSPDTNDTSVSYVSNITQNAEGGTFKYPGLLKTGESATFWLVERTLDGGFTCAGGSCFRGDKIRDICWGSYTASSYASGEKPAILVSIYYDWTGSAKGNLVSSGGTDFTNIKVVRQGYDPDGTRNNSNNFLDSAGGTCRIGETTYAFHTGQILFPTNIPIDNNCWNNAGCLVMLKVRVFYNNSNKPEQVAIDTGAGSAVLPAQGTRIESTGVAGESTRRVNVFQTYSEPPSIFDAAVFSLKDFSKN